MGFRAEALRESQSPGQRVGGVVQVQLNGDVLHRLLNQARDVEQQIETVDRMLRLGANTEMASQFYGLTHQEVALRRSTIALHVL